MHIRHVMASDLPRLMAIEQASFTVEEAATAEAFSERIAHIADSFFVAEEDGVIIGLINGPVVAVRYITDDLFTTITPNVQSGGHQTVLGLAVDPAYRNRGVATALLAALEREAICKQRETVTLTCQASLISFYERHGYVNEGVSSSTHAGITWYNVVKPLRGLK